jgi:hypothetical protein
MTSRHAHGNAAPSVLLLILLLPACRASVPVATNDDCAATASLQHVMRDAYDTRFTVADGIVRISGEGTGSLFGRSALFAHETPRMDSVPNRLTGTVSLSHGADTLWLSYDVISVPPQPAAEITISGPFEVTGGTGRFRCAAGGGTMSGSASLRDRTGRNVFDGVVLTPRPDR